MENFDKKPLIGLGLIVVMYSVWFYFYNSGTVKPLPEANKPKVEKILPAVENKAVLPLDTSQAVAQISTIETKKAIYKINSKGAKIEEVNLKEFKTYDQYISQKQGQLPLYGDPANKLGLELNIGSAVLRTDELVFNTTDTGNISVKDGQNTSVNFTAVLPTGVLKKTLSFSNDGYLVKESYDLSALNTAPTSAQLTWTNELKKLENDLSENKKGAQINYVDKEGEFSDVGFGVATDSDDDEEIPLKWISFKQKYFTSGLIFNNGYFEKSKFKLTAGTDSVKVKNGEFTAAIAADALKSKNLDFSYYFGPNDIKILETVGNDFHKNVYLGYDIVKPINRYVFVPLFNWVEGFLKNYGLLIILVVFIIKIAVTPLIYKSYISSAKMRILAPEVNAIKEKIGDDAMKVQQETMKLYQQVGVSPLSGCVPLLLQMPILMSVFFLFPNMLMFRQKEFLWAKDLSTYDYPINWGFDIPLIGHHISLFVVLMTLSSLAFTYYNNQITPDQPGPIDMKKISYIMPLIFFFVLNSFPAALSFYYLVSNLVTIGQQLIIRKFIDEDKITQLLENNRKTNSSKPQKKNKFAEFMEKQVKASEEVKKAAEDRKKTNKKK